MRRGVLYGVAAYILWGLFPLYWPLLKPSGAVEILAHRMVWSLVAVVAILAVRRHWSWIKGLVAQPRKLGLLTLAAVIITVNWGTYIYAVNTGHVVEAALGYFINPLVSVVFGVVLLRERLRRLQWVAVGFGALAVLVLAVNYGRPPYMALVLAVSFGAYGLIKKQANVGAGESLTVETLVLLLPALGYLVFLQQAGQATFGDRGRGAPPAAGRRGRDHGGAADALHRRRQPGAAEHDRAVAVHRARPAVPVRGADRQGDHAAEPVDRVLAGVARTGDLHVRQLPYGAGRTHRQVSPNARPRSHIATGRRPGPGCREGWRCRPAPG